MRSRFRLENDALSLPRVRSKGSAVRASSWGPASARLGFVALLASSLIGVALAKADDATSDETSEWSAIEVAGERVEPAETKRFFVDMARTVGGNSRMLDTFVVVTRGHRLGPTLCLTAGIHGDEVNGIEVAHRVYASISADDLSGTLITVPAVNMPGLRSGSRYLPDRRDLNRAFPGNPKGSLASRIAYTLYEGVIRHCDALIDLHTGSASRTNLPQIRTDLESEAAYAMARSFGVGVVLHGRGPSGSLRRAVLDGGVPAVIYEAGGPLRFEEDEITRGVEGVRNVMAEMEMIAETPEHRPSEVYRKTTWVRADDAIGVFLSERKPGDYVKEGDVLGTVTDPLTEDTSSILAPRDARILGMAVPQMVLPGYGLFNLGFDPE